MLNTLKYYIKCFFNLFYPDICVCCSNMLINEENIICFHCLYSFPITGYKFDQSNKVAQIFWGRVKFNKAIALYNYKKDKKFQNIIHKLKYKNNYKLGELMGEKLGDLIKKSFYEKIDFIITIPLHPKKYKIRGFNQSDSIAKGISNILSIDTNFNNVIRTRHTDSQTLKSREERIENVANVFSVINKNLFENKHILIVDDVITTGATMESCINELNKLPNIKISIASLAVADDSF